FQVAELGHFALGELHHVLDAVAHVDEAEAVVLESQRREGRKLLVGRLVVRGLVAKARNDNAGLIGHDARIGGRWVLLVFEKRAAGGKARWARRTSSRGYMALAYWAVTVSVIPPRALNAATTFIQRGLE